jgi:TPR repeat protein
MPEVPENMQENIAHLELEANGPRSAAGPMSPSHHQQYNQYGNQDSTNFPPRGSSYAPEQAPNDTYGGHGHGHGQGHGQGQWPTRQQSISSTFKQPPNVQPVQQQQPSHDYNQFAHHNEIPNFSIFPKLHVRPPNVPPSDDEKEAVLENARLPVLNSNDPEMQLAWAQDALAYVDAAMLHEQRLAEIQTARPVTPQVEHQLRVDAMNVVGFLADQHHPKAEFMRGMWLEFGKFGLRVDKKEAFRCYTRAAQKGFARAEYRMGMQFEQANDPIKALQNYKQGSEAGDSASNYRLGMMTLLGQHGQPQDYVKGVQLIRLAASTADENAPQGAYVLGMLQARELPQINVPEIYLAYDEKAAKMNIEKAAYLGFAKAQLKMGSAYELCSLGSEFNPTLSMHYNALASRQGEAEADMAISKWFLCGYEGEFPKNEELAYQYAQRAAQAGLATAEFAMGYFNEIGMHVPVNIDKALEWYDKASRNGNTDAMARIESISKSRTLSKKDHENVAISRIKSQHGSMRGQRPLRLQKSSIPPMPSINDSSPSDYGSSNSSAISASGMSQLPDRGTTPYPLSDRPPVIAANSAPSAPYDRPATVTPYPMDNGPPRVGGQRPAIAGGFVPEVRSASARPSSSAFNINPNLYGAPPANDGYGGGRLPPQGPPGPGGPGGRGMAPLPLRPHTSADDMGQGRGRASNGGRGTLPPGPGAYRQPGGPAAQRHDQYDRPATTQPQQQPHLPDIGFTAPPDNRNRLPKSNQPGQPLKRAPTLPDIGYVAPLEPRQQNRPSTVQPVQEGRSSARPDQRPSTAAPGPRMSSRPGTANNASGPAPGRLMHQDTMSSQPSNKPASRPPPAVQQPPKQTPPPAQAVKPSGPAAPAPKPAAPKPTEYPPGKGPKTFDEMGIGQTKDDKDCVRNIRSFFSHLAFH